VEAPRLLIIFIMGVLAFGARALPQVLFVARSFPPSWDRFLRYLSYALICSIVSTTLFMSGGRFETSTAPHRAAALVVAIAVARRTKSAVTGMIIGAALTSLLSWLY
jgi:branched-subunit amino acid transport protein